MLKKLLPDAPLLVGVVQSVVSGGCYVVLPGGAVILARGIGTVAQSVFIRDGMIEGPAPSFSVINIEV